MVNKITWKKAGGVTEPGRYMFTFGYLTVTAEDIAIWKQFPDAAFTLVEIPCGQDIPAEGNVEKTANQPAEEFHLGAFELPASH